MTKTKPMTSEEAKEYLLLALTKTCKELTKEQHAIINDLRTTSRNFLAIYNANSIDVGTIMTKHMTRHMARKTVHSAIKDAMAQDPEVGKQKSRQLASFFCRGEQIPGTKRGVLKGLKTGDETFTRACEVAEKGYKAREIIRATEEKRAARVERVRASTFIL